MSDVTTTDHDWPLFGLRIACGPVSLRPVRESDLPLLADLQPDDYEHDPAAERFAGLTLDQHRRRLAHQDYWRAVGTWSPASWDQAFVVEVAGEVVGVQSVEAEDFHRRRTVDSGSWLVRSARGQGVGKAIRQSVLGLAFCRRPVLSCN